MPGAGLGAAGSEMIVVVLSLQGFSHSSESTAVTRMPRRWGEVLINAVETQSSHGGLEEASKEHTHPVWGQLTWGVPLLPPLSSLSLPLSMQPVGMAASGSSLLSNPNNSASSCHFPWVPSLLLRLTYSF